MDRVSKMGTPRDMLQRVSLARIDDVKQRIRAKAAHDAIYKHNHGVGDAAVEKLLKEDSLNTHLVRHTSLCQPPA